MNTGKIQSAVLHWAPRLAANGINLTDFEDVVAELQNWDGWCSAFCNKAAVHEGLGEEALARGNAYPRVNIFSGRCLLPFREVLVCARF